MHESVIDWLGQKLSSVRTDHYYYKNAPEANSIRPAAAVALFNTRHEMLMLKRADNEKWAMPGGTLEFGQSLLQCALREVREECGLDVLTTDIIGTYTDPNGKVAYSDGEVRQEFTIVYMGEANGGNLKINGESTAYRWMGMDDIDNLPMAGPQRKRVADVKL